MTPIVFILICVFLNSCGQLFLKYGARSLGGKISPSISTLQLILTNPSILAGTALYAVSLIVWIYVLTKTKLSYAYPFISLSYAVVALLAFLLLGEKVSVEGWVGIILVVTGVSLLGIGMK